MQGDRDIRRRLRDQGGYMLVELITAATLTVMIMGTFGVMLLAGNKHEPEISERSQDIEQGRVAVERMTREIRAGYQIVGTTSPSRVTFNTFAASAGCGAVACRVTYSCTATSCTRTVAQANGTGAGPSRQIVSGLASAAVFTYTPSAADPAHVTVTLTFSGDASDGESVTVSDGAELRNQR